MNHEMTYYAICPSPIGELLLTSNGRALTGLHMDAAKNPRQPAAGWARQDDGVLAEARRELEAYFAGALTEFTVALAPEGTPFQREVWTALCEIPYGTTISYGELARRVGNVSASRAVGAANGRNPIAVIVPCHRVIGANGTLTGYGGGLDRKRTLLALESEVAAKQGLRLL